MWHQWRRVWTLALGLAVLSLSGCTRTPELEVIGALDQAPGNITVTPERRIILSMHPFFNPDWRVAEWTEAGLRPFPNADIATGVDPGVPLYSVLGIRSDSRGIVWMLDNGRRGLAPPRLVAWDTRGNALHQIIPLPEPVTPPDTFVNDLAIDETPAYLYRRPAGGGVGPDRGRHAQRQRPASAAGRSQRGAGRP
jgi:hypothetical protein